MKSPPAFLYGKAGGSFGVQISVYRFVLHVIANQ